MAGCHLVSDSVCLCSWLIGMLSAGVVHRTHEALITVLTIMFLMPTGHLFHFSILPGAIVRLATLVFRECFYALYFVNRCRHSRKARAKSKKEIEVQAIEKKVVYTGPFTTKLEEVLALEEVVLVIASQLHYYEIMRLGWTSKHIRELVFPHRDLKMRKAKLRRVAKCEDGDSRCWNCNIKTCVGHEQTSRNYSVRARLFRSCYIADLL